MVVMGARGGAAGGYTVAAISHLGVFPMWLTIPGEDAKLVYPAVKRRTRKHGGDTWSRCGKQSWAGERKGEKGGEGGRGG